MKKDGIQTRNRKSTSTSRSTTTAGNGKQQLNTSAGSTGSNSSNVSTTGRFGAPAGFSAGLDMDPASFVAWTQSSSPAAVDPSPFFGRYGSSFPGCFPVAPPPPPFFKPPAASSASGRVQDSSAATGFTTAFDARASDTQYPGAATSQQDAGAAAGLDPASDYPTFGGYSTTSVGLCHNLAGCF